ncbi:hypothetical protein Sm713_69180 [Streptomyces sp. TS71-3]|nr:hypothetical protein Sm713_69180 [Streptomyces sp. TS71-3]
MGNVRLLAGAGAAADLNRGDVDVSTGDWGTGAETRRPRRSRRECWRQVYFVDDPDAVTVVRSMAGQLAVEASRSPALARRMREAGG